MQLHIILRSKVRVFKYKFKKCKVRVRGCCKGADEVRQQCAQKGVVTAERKCWCELSYYYSMMQAIVMARTEAVCTLYKFQNGGSSKVHYSRNAIT